MYSSIEAKYVASYTPSFSSYRHVTIIFSYLPTTSSNIKWATSKVAGYAYNYEAMEV